jgi:hypothetical protein
LVECIDRSCDDGAIAFVVLIVSGVTVCIEIPNGIDYVGFRSIRIPARVCCWARGARVEPELSSG